jgi:hypothetical protein
MTNCAGAKSNQFYTYLSEQIQPEDLFIFPSQELHMAGVSACLFPGRQYAYQSEKIGKLFDAIFFGEA